MQDMCAHFLSLDLDKQCMFLFPGSRSWRSSPTATAMSSFPVFVRFPNTLSNAGSRTDHASDGFAYVDDQVRPQDEEEAALFRLLESVTQQSAASLSARWREPSLTIHSVRGSGPTSTFRVFTCLFTWLNATRDDKIQRLYPRPSPRRSHCA